MTALVRVRKHQDLVDRIDETGTQVDVAAAAGLSTQRINQIYTGSHATIEVRKARRLEEVLGVPHGTFFAAVDAALIAPYVHADAENDPDGAPEAEANEPAPGDEPPASTPASPTVSASAA